MLFRSGTFASALTDEGQAFHVQAGYEVQRYYVGNVDASTAAQWKSAPRGEDDYLSKWTTIRRAYVLLENIDRCPDATYNQKERIKAEAKLMIATVYFEMFKRYGGVPIVRYAYTGSESESEINLPRATLEETFDFIISILDEVISAYHDVLPANLGESNDEFGRFPMAFAYALKARAKLYAASPLYNTSNPYSDELGENSNLICFMNYNKNRWKDAADAATDAINYCLSNGYRLVDDADKRDNAMNYTIANMQRPATGNTEVIWGINQAASSNFGYFTAVRYFSGAPYGYACNLVPLNQVERYELNTENPGEYKDWDQIQSFDINVPNGSSAEVGQLLVAEAARKPYSGLDPRCYASIVDNGDNNYGSYSTTRLIDMADAYTDNGVAIPNLHGQLSSGRQNTTILHYVRKFSRGYEGREGSVRPFNIYFRMAELYLIRAEALNEFNSTPNSDTYNDLNMIRNRSGMCNVKMNQSQDEMRETIAHERNIEMYYEDQRWFDLRRTLQSAEKIPVEINKIQIRKIYKTSADSWPYKIIYEKVPYQKRYWSNHWYMNPFPKSEINKFYGLIQNPGW